VCGALAIDNRESAVSSESEVAFRRFSSTQHSMKPSDLIAWTSILSPIECMLLAAVITGPAALAGLGRAALSVTSTTGAGGLC
jgi:hypothetical protein